MLEYPFFMFVFLLAIVTVITTNNSKDLAQKREVQSHSLVRVGPMGYVSNGIVEKHYLFLSRGSNKVLSGLARSGSGDKGDYIAEQPGKAVRREYH